VATQRMISTTCESTGYIRASRDEANDNLELRQS